MNMRVNRSCYEIMIQDQINHMDSNRHDRMDEGFVADVLEESVYFHYDLLPALKRVFDIQGYTWKDAVSDADLMIINGFIKREFANDQ